MRRYLFDTGIAQDFVNGRNGIPERADQERHRGGRIGTCIPVLGELGSGVECSATRDRKGQKLRHGLSRLVVWPYPAEAA